MDQLGIGFVAYSPLGRGFITGTAKPAGQYEATEIRNVDSRRQPGNFEKNIEAVDRLAEIAAAKGATVSQLALAWLLTRGEHIVPIPGTRGPKRIRPEDGPGHGRSSCVSLTRARQSAPTRAGRARSRRSGSTGRLPACCGHRWCRPRGGRAG